MNQVFPNAVDGTSKADAAKLVLAHMRAELRDLAQEMRERWGEVQDSDERFTWEDETDPKWINAPFRVLVIRDEFRERWDEYRAFMRRLYRHKRYGLL